MNVQDEAPPSNGRLPEDSRALEDGIKTGRLLPGGLQRGQLLEQAAHDALKVYAPIKKTRQDVAIV